VDVRTGENNRESWWVTNNTNKTITIGDLLLIPAIKPGKRVDLLHHYTREKISHSTVLVQLIKAGLVSLDKDKSFTDNNLPGNVSVRDIDKAITPAEENETGAVLYHVTKDNYLVRTSLTTNTLEETEMYITDDNHISNVGGISFDTNPSPTITHEEGHLHWSDEDGTLNLNMPGGEVVLQIGQENLVKVANVTGTPIANGKVVYITGAQGQRPTVALADNTDPDMMHILGVATEEIVNSGYVTTFGYVRGINTNAWSEGDKLYLSTNGDLINTHPVSSTTGVIVVGEVTKKHNSEGHILLSNFQEFTIGNDFNGTIRQSVMNKNTGALAASGFTAVNDAGYFTTFGIAGTGNTTFQDANGDPVSVHYAPGYGDHWQAVDGNKDFVWFTDPEDLHANNSLNYERMRLKANGDLLLYNKFYLGDNQDASIFFDGTDLNITLNDPSQTGLIKLTDSVSIDGDLFLNTVSEATSNNILVWDSTSKKVEYKEDISTSTLEPTGFENQTDSIIEFDNGTRTFSIYPTNSSYVYYLRGNKITKTGTDTTTITDTNGLWFIYFDENEVLQSSQTVWSFEEPQIFVAIVYWDGTNGTIGEERHGLTMDWATHQYNHESKGTVYVSGYAPSLTFGNGSDNTHAEMQSITSGTIYDEDIINTNDDSQTSYQLWYKLGSGVGITWNFFTASSALAYVTGGSRPYFNEDNGGTWQLTQTTNTNYILTHIFATNKIEYTGSTKITDNRIILIMGENQYSSGPAAEEGALTEIYELTTAGLPSVEFHPIATVIIECRNTFSNNYKARVITIPSDGSEYIDFRVGGRIGVGGVSSHHGNLTGLSDDDHSQYLLLAGRGGQTISDDITLPTSNNIYFGSEQETFLTYDGTDLNIGFSSPSAGDLNQQVRVNDDLSVDGILTVGTNSIVIDGDKGTIKINGNPIVLSPIGSITAWDKTPIQTPSIPEGWVECNGQTISDAESVYNGVTIKNLNGSGGGTKRFIRGSTTSGTIGGTGCHTHSIACTGYTCVSTQINLCATGYTGCTTIVQSGCGATVASPTHSHSVSGCGFGIGHSHLNPDTDYSDHLPQHIEMVYIMRIK
jgi:hypothetical protein